MPWAYGFVKAGGVQAPGEALQIPDWEPQQLRVIDARVGPLEQDTVCEDAQELANDRPHPGGKPGYAFSTTSRNTQQHAPGHGCVAPHTPNPWHAVVLHSGATGGWPPVPRPQCSASWLPTLPTS